MLRSLLVLGILIPGIFAAMRDRFHALLLYLWYALFRPDAWLYFDITAFRPSLVLGLLVVVPSLLTGVMPNVTHPLSIGSLVFLGSALIAQMNAVRLDIAWEWTYYFIRLLFIALIAVTLLSDRRRIVIAQSVIAGSFGFFTGKAGVVYLLGGGVVFAEGMGGAFPDNEGYALGTAMIIPLLISTAANTPVLPLRIGFRVTAFMSVFTIFGTFSRGGFLALVAAILAMIVVRPGRAKNLTALTIVAVLVYLFAPIPSSYLDRLNTIVTYEEVGDRSALSRFHFWEVAMKMVADRPFGIGLHNYEAAYDMYDFTGGEFGGDRAVHSSHFEVLAETGYIGAAAWVALFAYAFLLTLRIRRRARAPGLVDDERAFIMHTTNGLLASMSAFVVGGSFLAVALNDLTWLTFALVASLDRVTLAMVAERRTAAPASNKPLSAVVARVPGMVPA